MMLIMGILLSSTVVFALTIGDLAWQNLLLGLLLSVAIMWVFRRQIVPTPLPANDLVAHLLIYSPKLLWYLLVDILKGTWVMSLTTLGLRPLSKPGIVRVPLGAHSPYGVGPVGFFITLSPGSFMVDIDWDTHEMLIHVIDASDPDQVRSDAEKYYRLWEYGRYTPTAWIEPEGEGEAPHA